MTPTEMQAEIAAMRAAMQHAADAIRANRPADALAFLAPWIKPGEVG